MEPRRSVRLKREPGPRRPALLLLFMAAALVAAALWIWREPLLAPFRSPEPGLPDEPTDPLLEPYQGLFTAADHLAAGQPTAALAELQEPPVDGYRAYLYHHLRSQALLSLNDAVAALAEAEWAHALAAGPERTEAAALLVRARQAAEDWPGAVDLLLELIPSSDLLFRGTLRDELIEQLQPLTDRLDHTDPANLERLLAAGDLFYRYGYSRFGIALFGRDGWPDRAAIGGPAATELAFQQARTRSMQGETAAAIDDLTALMAGAEAAEAARLQALIASYLNALGRGDEAPAAYAAAAAAGPGTYWGGQAVYRQAEPYLDADDAAPAEAILTENAERFRETEGWQRGAWELVFSFYATGDLPGVRRALDLLHPVAADHPQYLFWRYQLAEDTGGGGQVTLQRLLNEHPFSYYALVARERWPRATAPLDPLLAPPDPDLQARLTALDRLTAADRAADSVWADADLSAPLALWRAGHRAAAAGELRRLGGTGESWELTYLLARWEGARGQHRESIAVMSRAGDLLGAPVPPAPILQGQYPRFFADLVAEQAGLRGVSPHLVFAIMREESAFEPLAFSTGDASGLMQIIPSTGQWLAEMTGMQGYTAQDLFRPEVGVLLGAAFLEWLLAYYDGDSRLAAAAYNGGPGNVDTWMALNPADDMALFVERIPFPETRNYVKTTDRSYRMYRLLYP